MSDTIIGVLVGGLMSGLFGLATLWINQRHNERLQSKQTEERRLERHDDYKEWYRRTLFEKQLAAAQEAHKWIIRIHFAAEGAAGNKELGQIAKEARAWYDENVIYLHDELPRSSTFVGLTNAPLDPKAFMDADRWIKARVKQLFGVEFASRTPS